MEVKEVIEEVEAKVPKEGDLIQFHDRDTMYLLNLTGDDEYRLTDLKGTKSYIVGNKDDVLRHLASFTHTHYPASEYSIILKKELTGGT